MLLVKKLHHPRVFIDGEYSRWVILIPDNALPIIMSFYRYTDLLRDEVADILAAPSTLLETVRVDI